ncbi:composite domain of metallo-dependent hydrolase [Mycena floridula]|nr:composite domain of metallo-dependent hydrolase [Mycena floridula]
MSEKTNLNHSPFKNNRAIILCSLIAGIALSQIFNGALVLWQRTGSRNISTARPLKTSTSKCSAINNFPARLRHIREISDRFESGTLPTLISNCTIFTAEENGTVIVQGDLLLDKGLIKAVGTIPLSMLGVYKNLTIIDAKGRWVTPGLVDMNSHLGILSSPLLQGANDLDSKKGPIVPWLRSSDGFNTHDEGFRLAVSHGVTSVLVAPGDANIIGGQAFVAKLRKTSEGSPSSMIVNSFDQNGMKWRYLRKACSGDSTRMDRMWALRSAYQEAQKIKNAQDLFCKNDEVRPDEQFPESFQWEILVAVLRGQVKVSIHCDEIVDFDDMVELSTEFQFPIGSFHHASEAWLVPQVLNRTWGGPPFVVMPLSGHRFSRGSMRMSEHSPRILTDDGIQVVITSGYPSSRDLLFEAQQAHFFGLPNALASVTSLPAAALGSDRLGSLAEGYDADVVLWNSHPLQPGATPMEVWIDGIPQLNLANQTEPDARLAEAPVAPDWTEERRKALQWEGLPPWKSRQHSGKMTFSNVSQVWTRKKDGSIEQVFSGTDPGEWAMVTVDKGQVICVGPEDECGSIQEARDLHGGSIAPGLMAYGSQLGLEEIRTEPSTGDGKIFNPFLAPVPEILRDVGAIIRAADSLVFGTRNAQVAYQSGITFGTSFVSSAGNEHNMFLGLSSTFRTGCEHAMQNGAVVQSISALHLDIRRTDDDAGVSIQIAALRRLLYGWESVDTETGAWFKQAAEGVIPLVLHVNNADIMASLLILKADVENNESDLSQLGSTMRMVFSGAAESAILAQEISKARVGVILTPMRPFPTTWDERRTMPGPPLSGSVLSVLLKHGVLVGIGQESAQEAQNLRFELAKASANEGLGELELLALVSKNLEKLLGIREVLSDLVVYEGGKFLELSKPVAVISPRRQFVEFF